MKTTSFFLFTFLSFSLIFNLKSFAQIRIGKDTKETIELRYKNTSALKKTTLMVALDDENSLVSKKLIANIETYWKFTPYQFIKATEITKYLKDPKYSILMLGGSGPDYDNAFGYCILLGDKKNKTTAEGAITAKVVSSVQLPDNWTKKTGLTLLDFKYLITFFVQALQKDVTDSYEKKVHKTYGYKNAYYFDGGVEEIKDMKVLISQDGLNPDFKKANFLKNFGLKDEQVIIVEKEDIEKALEIQDDKVAFIYDFTGKLGTIYSVKNAHAIAYGSDYNMKPYKIWLYGASAVGLGAFIYYVKTRGAADEQ